MGNSAEVRHVSVSIERTADDVYRHALDVSTWVAWAHGLGTSVRREGEVWIADGPLGEVTLRLAEPNAFRVLDHDVTLATGETFHNPLRVLPNGATSELVFSVFRRSGASDDDFRADTSAVERDLRTLKAILER